MSDLSDLSDLSDSEHREAEVPNATVKAHWRSSRG